jgi:hypothetical protein
VSVISGSYHGGCGRGCGGGRLVPPRADLVRSVTGSADDDVRLTGAHVRRPAPRRSRLHRCRVAAGGCGPDPGRGWSCDARHRSRVSQGGADRRLVYVAGRRANRQEPGMSERSEPTTDIAEPFLRGDRVDSVTEAFVPTATCCSPSPRVRPPTPTTCRRRPGWGGWASISTPCGAHRGAGKVARLLAAVWYRQQRKLGRAGIGQWWHGAARPSQGGRSTACWRCGSRTATSPALTTCEIPRSFACGAGDRREPLRPERPTARCAPSSQDDSEVMASGA